LVLFSSWIPNHGNEIIREKNCRHVVNKDGGQDRFNILKSTCMIDSIGFKSDEFSNEFVVYELISFVFIFVREN
jgi:hypothetical protein